MELHVLLWILGGGFAGTWGLCIFFMNRTDNGMIELRREMSGAITEIRKEISVLNSCSKEYHGRLSRIEERNRNQRK